MKRGILIICILMIGSLSAQELKPIYEKTGDVIKYTSFHDNGKVNEIGYYKDKKLTGVWKKYNDQGKKITLANYKEGKKVGKWFFWTKDGLKEINYNNNVIENVQSWKPDNQLAVK